MSRDVDFFVRDFVKELREDNAAVFVGAGFSAPAGFVNWRDLLRPIADELQLDIEREHDLVAIAQYHSNENGGQRTTMKAARAAAHRGHGISIDSS